jgi:hypothetical protein
MSTETGGWYVEDELVRERLDEKLLYRGPETREECGRVLKAYITSFVRDDLVDVSLEGWDELGELAESMDVTDERIERAALSVVDRVFHAQRARFRESDIERLVDEEGCRAVRELACSVEPVTVEEVAAALEEQGQR